MMSFVGTGNSGNAPTDSCTFVMQMGLRVCFLSGWFSPPHFSLMIVVILVILGMPLLQNWVASPALFQLWLNILINFPGWPQIPGPPASACHKPGLQVCTSQPPNFKQWRFALIFFFFLILCDGQLPKWFGLALQEPSEHLPFLKWCICYMLGWHGLQGVFATF